MRKLRLREGSSLAQGQVASQRQDQNLNCSWADLMSLTPEAPREVGSGAELIPGPGDISGGEGSSLSAQGSDPDLGKEPSLWPPHFPPTHQECLNVGLAEGLDSRPTGCWQSHGPGAPRAGAGDSKGSASSSQGTYYAPQGQDPSLLPPALPSCFWLGLRYPGFSWPARPVGPPAVPLLVPMSTGCLPRLADSGHSPCL